jgi:RNase P/RNase MRP subunit POP5
MIQAIQRAAEASGATACEPWLTRFNGEHGILRVLRGTEDQGIRLLTGVGTVTTDAGQAAVAITTLSTSGTIASLQRKALRGIRLDA